MLAEKFFLLLETLKSDHFDTLAGRVLRRYALVLQALGRDHDGLRHHDGAIAQGSGARPPR